MYELLRLLKILFRGIQIVENVILFINCLLVTFVLHYKNDCRKIFGSNEGFANELLKTTSRFVAKNFT